MLLTGLEVLEVRQTWHNAGGVLVSAHLRYVWYRAVLAFFVLLTRYDSFSLRLFVQGEGGATTPQICLAYCASLLVLEYLVYRMG